MDERNDELDVLDQINSLLDSRCDGCLEKAFFIASASRDIKVILEKGKMLFYGIGCKANIYEALSCFRFYLDNKNDITFNTQCNVTPYIAQCYYEDFLLNNNPDSLKELISLAEFHDCRLAQRYLRRHFKTIHDPINEKKYSDLLVSKREQNEQDLITPIEIISIKSKLMFASIYYNGNSEDDLGCMIKLRDHLLLENFDRNNDEYEGIVISQLYLVMASILSDMEENKAVQRNLLRARVYLENYFELSSEAKDSENYKNAIALYDYVVHPNKGNANQNDKECSANDLGQGVNYDSRELREYCENSDNIILLVDLDDKNSIFQIIANGGYLSLLSALFGVDSFVTYRHLINNMGLYIGRVVDSESNKLTEHELNDLQKAFGLSDGRYNTFVESKNVSEVMKKLRSPELMQALSNAFWDDNDKPRTNKVHYGDYLNKGIKLEVENYIKHGTPVLEGMLSNKVTPRFFNESTKEWNVSIDNLDLSSECIGLLKNKGITSIAQLIHLQKEDYKNVVGITKSRIEEIEQAIDTFREYRFHLENGKVQINNSMKRYFYSEMFDNSAGLITNTMLPLGNMIELIKRGFWFIEDFLQYYDFFVGRHDNEMKSIMNFDNDYLKVLKYYSRPVLWIKIPSFTQHALKFHDIYSFNDFEKRISEIPRGVKGVYGIYSVMRDAYSSACILKKRYRIA